MLLFEDIPMLTYHAAYLSGALKVNIKNLNQTLFFQQLGTTLLSFTTTIYMLWFESLGIEENPLEYLMLSIKAK